MFEVDLHQAPYEVNDLDAAACLERIKECDVRARMVERGKFRLVSQWCRLRTVADPEEAADWGEALSGSDRDCDLPIGGPGTPMVARYSAAPLGAALEVSTASATALMSATLDLDYRLPLLRGQVEDLSLPFWKACRVAEETTMFSKEAAAFVDEQLAGRAQGFGMRTLDRIVAMAMAKFHPEMIDEAEKAANAHWGVELQHTPSGRFTGTSDLTATGDTVALTRFYELVKTVAIALGRLGDKDPLPVREAKAFGIIADPEELADLLMRADNASGADGDEGQGGAESGTDGQADKTDPKPKPAASGRKAPPSAGVIGGLVRKPGKFKFYAHFSAADLVAVGAARGESVVIGEVERLGPATLAKISEWLDTSGATIVPVIDLNRTDSVDVHDPPEWMRELVILRDRHCIFPWCACDARSCDLDHIEPYVHGTDGDRAPPGQTRPENLAPLCRHHHRIKTFTGWTYRRLPDGSYRWKDPFGNIYRVSEAGTESLSRF